MHVQNSNTTYQNSAANKGWSTINYRQSLVFDCPYLSCNDHCDWWLLFLFPRNSIFFVCSFTPCFVIILCINVLHLFVTFQASSRKLTWKLDNLKVHFRVRFNEPVQVQNVKSVITYRVIAKQHAKREHIR